LRTVTQVWPIKGGPSASQVRDSAKRFQYSEAGLLGMEQLAKNISDLIISAISERIACHRPGMHVLSLENDSKKTMVRFIKTMTAQVRRRNQVPGTFQNPEANTKSA
jgi:hypothetical protein